MEEFEEAKLGAGDLEFGFCHPTAGSLISITKCAMAFKSESLQAKERPSRE